MPHKPRRGPVPVLVGIVALLSLASCTTVRVRLAMNEGVNLFKSKEYERAVESFKKAIAIDANYSEGYLDLGLTYMELYEPGSEHPKDAEYAEGAIEAFKKYISLNPTSEKAKEYLINICNLAHRMNDAIDFFLLDYEKNPGDLDLVKKLAALYRMAGETEKAIDFYQKAAELDPGNAESFYSVGVSCWGRSYHSPYLEYEARMSLLDRGQAALEKAIAIKKDYFEAYLYLNLLFRQKAQYDISPAQAMTWRQKADELQAKALELRAVAMQAQAAAAAAGGTQPSTPAPASPGGK